MVRIVLLNQGPSRHALKQGLERYAPVEFWDDPDQLPTSRGALTLLHPGLGPHSEDPAFWTRCQDRGLIPLMPHPRHLTWSRNKLQLLREAETQGLATLLLHEEPFSNVSELEAFIQDRGLRFPLVLKSVLGSGSWGVWVVQGWEDLKEKAPRWFDQLRLRREQPLVFVERYLTESRHWVLGFSRNAEGHCVFPWLSEASLQSRYRKVIEWHTSGETIPEWLGETAHAQMRAAAEKLLHHIGFVGVGALEFLVDVTQPYLVEMLPRLPTHWPAWGLSSGIDPLALQLEAYTGEAYLETQARSAPWVAVARVMAEDPILELPRPGHVQKLRKPQEWIGDLRVGEVAPSADPCLGLALGRGDSIDSARRDLLRHLSELWMAGTLATNERFLRELLDHPWVREGHFHAGFVDEEFVPAVTPPDALITEMRDAIQRTRDSQCVETRDFVGYALPKDPRHWRLRAGSWWVDIRQKAATPSDQGVRLLELRALCGGKVRAIFFREMALVPAHESVLWLESFGTLVPHALPRDLWIHEWKVAPEDVVQEGQLLGLCRATPAF